MEAVKRPARSKTQILPVESSKSSATRRLFRHRHGGCHTWEIRSQAVGTALCVHALGHGSFEPITAKPNLMVRLDQGGVGKKAFGHKRLLLDNSSQDKSFIRWKLASELFLNAGLQAARVNFARVKLNARDLELYVMVEPSDKAFLARHFGLGTGNSLRRQQHRRGG
jgi:hypothetical protein